MEVRGNILGAIAIFLALSGVAYGAGALPKNSVGTKQLRNGAVTAKKVKKGSLTGTQIKASTLGTVPSAVNADTLDGKHASDFLGAGATASGALAGAYPNPTLAVSGGPCANGQALTNIASSAALTCGPGVYSGPNDNSAVTPNPFPALTTGKENSAFGPGALLSNTTGNYNTAVGQWALQSNVTGSFNSAFGRNALDANITGSDNAAFGNYAIMSNTTGTANSAMGTGALIANTTGFNNAALGEKALSFNTTGHDNSAVGRGALQFNETGNYNSAVGNNALYTSSTGNDNSALGERSLYNSTTGNNNSAVGQSALFSNTTGDNNAALGHNALASNTTGAFNTALGKNAGQNLTTGDNNIDIGNFGAAGESNTIRIGSQGTQSRAFLAGVSGATTEGVAAQVLVDANGQLGTTSSSRRFKRDIHPLDSRIEGLMALRPVSFRYRRSVVHGASPLQFGLIAEQVAKVYPNLVVNGLDGKPDAVAYQELPALLLAQAQRQQERIERQRREIRALRAKTRGLGRLHAQVRWLMRHAPSH